MDTLRGSFTALDDRRGYDTADDESENDMPPAAIGQDERRMQVRAYNHWASLLEERNFPPIDGLEPENLPDFGPYSVLLDFSRGLENPGIAYLGAKLAVECDITSTNLQNLSDVPARSLLSRITDHYMQILANQAPIGFEAEFVNQRGNTILYRGILLPFSSDDDTIDFIYGVINWKELADQHTSDELLLEIDQALEARPEPAPARKDNAPLTDWADGPGAAPANDLDTEEGFEDYVETAGETDQPAYGTFDPRKYVGSLDDEDDDEEGYAEGGEPGELPSPTFGLSAYDPSDYTSDEEEEDSEDQADNGKYAGLVSAQELSDATKARKMPLELGDPEDDDFRQDFADPQDFGFSELPGEPAGMSYDAPAMAEIELEDMQLADWLAAAREMAATATSSEDRTRSALYEAIGRAYDFSIAAVDAPAEFEEILTESGLSMQDRAPMTPVVKLVFGADYDKTRVTEYAAALSYAHRCEVQRGRLAEYLRHAEGGLKGVVKAERRLRREEAGKPVDDEGTLREALAKKLRRIEPQAFEELEAEGAEFALVMIRRTATGEIVVIGEVPEDISLLERAGRKLVG